MEWPSVHIRLTDGILGVRCLKLGGRVYAESCASFGRFLVCETDAMCLLDAFLSPRLCLFDMGYICNAPALHCSLMSALGHPHLFKTDCTVSV